MSDNFMVNFILFCVILLFMLLLNLLMIYISSLFNINKDNRVYQKNVCACGLLLVAAYLILNFLSLCGKIISSYSTLFQDIVFERWLAVVVVILFFIYKIIILNKNDKKIKGIFPYYFDNVEQKYYISNYYYNIGKELKIASYIFAFIFALGQTIFIFNNIGVWIVSGLGVRLFIYNYYYIFNMCIIFLILYEIGSFLQGNVKNVDKYINKAKVNQDRFDAMLEEYNKIFKQNILLRFDKNDELNNNVSDQNSANDDYIYSKIFTPITEGKNIIVETENLYFLADIVPPIINLIFATNRKIAFLTESDTETLNTFKWLKKCRVITDNMQHAVAVLTEDKEINSLPDNNIDICIGTVDLLLENRDLIENIDTIFSINIDNIISDNSINLSIMTKIFNEIKNKKIQYILFANEQNGLKQTIEAMFYNSNFNYQVVRSRMVNNFHAIFYAKEKGWLQKVVLPADAREILGHVLPLLITPLKYDFDNLQAFSSSEPYDDEMRELHVNAPNLKVYVNNSNVLDIEDKIDFSTNEHFSENLDSMIVAYDDCENNLVSLLKNYIKYSQSRILLNIVSNNYLLRDYMIDNIDFMMQNNVFLGKIVPQHIDGDKLLLYKIINELILNYVEEDDLVLELCKINSEDYDKISVDKRENFILSSINDLIKKVFNLDVNIKPYFHRELKYRTNIKEIYQYNLSEKIKSELPQRLFKQIIFISSDQKAKTLKRVPLFEMYQNYTEGQYVVFDGKCYYINNIDDQNGIVDLIYNDRIINAIYRFKKDVTISKYSIINDEKDEFNFKEVQYVKKEAIIDAEVVYEGFYEFYNGLQFENGSYKYNKNNVNKGIKKNIYNNQKAIFIGFYNDKIGKFSDLERLKISETLAFIMNEIFKTIFYGLNQYIIVKAITNKNVDYDNEILNMYSPVVISEFNDSIGLFIMEDTELEKGLLDSFNLKLDTTILPLITDYLEWVIDDEKDVVKSIQIENEENKDNYLDSYIYTYSKEKLWFNRNDKTAFLKLGSNKINDIFDLKNTLELLRLINIKGNNSMSIRRKEFKKKRLLMNVLLDGKIEENEDLFEENITNIRNENDNIIKENDNFSKDEFSSNKNEQFNSSISNENYSGVEGTVCILNGDSKDNFAIGALVEIYDFSNKLIVKTITDDNGKYKISLKPNSYKMIISYKDYENNESIQKVKTNKITYIEIITLFPKQQGKGKAGGVITNAINNIGVQGVKIKLRKSWNNYDGEYVDKINVLTDKNGRYILTNIQVGYYTIEAYKEGFIKQYKNIEVLNKNHKMDFDFSINPIMSNDGEVRIVLLWDLEPPDLDAHLIGKKPNGEYFDVNYNEKVYNYNSILMANLDVDQKLGTGPETITIKSQINGEYVYGVHDYTNRLFGHLNKLSYSNSKVYVYIGNKLVEEFHIPTGVVGTFWEVFKINENGNITPINKIYNYSPLDKNYERFNIEDSCNTIYSPVENVEQYFEEKRHEDNSNKDDDNLKENNDKEVNNKRNGFLSFFSLFSKKDSNNLSNKSKNDDIANTVENWSKDLSKNNDEDINISSNFNDKIINNDINDNTLNSEDVINNEVEISNKVEINNEKNRNDISKNKNGTNYEYVVSKDVTKEDVIKYLEDNLYNPILNNKDIPQNIIKQISTKKSKINTSNWNVLSIVNYVLHSTKSSYGKKLHNDLKKLNLPNIEDNLNEFMTKFSVKKN